MAAAHAPPSPALLASHSFDCVDYVVAIDMGMHGTGAAVLPASHRPLSRSEVMSMITLMAPGARTEAEVTGKARTAILVPRAAVEGLTSEMPWFDDSVGYGDAAVARYQQLMCAARPEDADTALFENFKRALLAGATTREERMIDRPVTAQTVGGASMTLPLVNVVAAMLHFTTTDVRARILRSDRREADDVHIKWVLTIPTSMSDEAQAVMRRAMYLAGAIPSEDSPDLCFGLEPECAALAAFANLWEQLYAGRTLHDRMVAIIVDSGKLTNDISVLRPVPESVLQLEHAESLYGDDKGGHLSDAAFLTMMKKLLERPFDGLHGAPLASAVSNKTWFHLNGRWEVLKRAYDPDAARSTWCVHLEDVVDDIFEATLALNADAERSSVLDALTAAVVARRHLYDAAAEDALHFSGDSAELHMKKSVMNALLASNVQAITTVLRQYMLSDGAPMRLNPTHIILVGGNGSCTAVRRAVENMELAPGETLRRVGTRVLTPDRAELAIAKGAAIFGGVEFGAFTFAGDERRISVGGRASCITKRRAMHTYAMLMVERTREALHPPFVRSPDGRYSRVLLPLIQRGAPIEEGAVLLEERFCPSLPTDDKCCAYFYRTDQTVHPLTSLTHRSVLAVDARAAGTPAPNLTYVLESDRLGKVDIPYGPHGADSRIVTLTVTVRGTELVFEVATASDKKRVRFNFYR